MTFVNEYAEEQIQAVVTGCDIQIEGETGTHYLALCPFHSNTDSPSFAIQKEGQGLFTCFNPSCEESGTLHSMVKRLKSFNDFEAARYIIKKGSESKLSMSDLMAKRLKKKVSFVRFEGDLERMHQDFWGSPAHEYMTDKRGFTDETLAYFQVGYSKNKAMVTVPMFAPDGMPVGLIGRSVEGKVFKNSTGLPKNETMWNFNNAKKHEQVIIVESSFDAMRIHQSGHPNVVAVLGGSISPHHFDQIAKTFTSVVIMTDEDDKRFTDDCAKCRKNGMALCVGHKPGVDLGLKIAAGCQGKKVYWAYHGETRFPTGCKDAGDMTDDQIRQCIRGRITPFEMSMKHNVG